jgi:multicomponent Na+:H+ antiporter subunit B
MSETNTQPEAESPVLAVVARLAVPLTVLLSIIIFFQGHNKPGGGFIAGVLAAIAGVIALLAYGVHAKVQAPWWVVIANGIVITIWTQSPSAGLITFAVGAAFNLIGCKKTIAQFEWWKMSVVGLLISLLAGVVPMLFGLAFMDHQLWHYTLIVHDHLPTATFFDIGVYLIVLGTLMTIFVELGQEGGE